jgi:FkbM family methyltransferase
MNINFIRDTGIVKWLVRKFVREFSKRVLKRDNFLHLPTGLLIRLPKENLFSSDVFVTNCDVDWGAEGLLARYLQQDGIFLDIGAHIGYYSLYMLPLVKAVYAFEPDARARAWLTSNLPIYPNASIVPAAVGARSGRATYVLAPAPDTSHLGSDSVMINALSGGESHATPANSEGNVVEVDVVTVDEFVAQHHLRVTAIKIDVEGFDLDVVASALETLRNQAPLVLTEARPEERLFQLISDLDYRVFAFTRDFKTGRRGFEKLYPHTTAHTKMLFFVPGRLAPEFSSLCGTKGPTVLN